MVTSLDREIDQMRAVLRMCQEEGLGVVRVKTERWEIEGAFKEQEQPSAIASNKTVYLGGGMFPANLDRNDPEAVEAYLEECKQRGMTAEDFE